jgi:kynurenine 3-monooxygenase
MRTRHVHIVGAGLAGALLAILLARRGFEISLYERRRDPRRSTADRGRSINLALAARGIAALERAGIMERVQPLMIAMRGRMVHELGAPPVLLPYGQRAREVIYSIGRAALNHLLIEEAARYVNVTLRFATACVGVQLPHGTLELRDESGATTLATPQGPVIATDGAGSTVRASLAQQGRVSVREEPLDHDYKELSMPAVGGHFALEPHALHIWPRHGCMLIALPNTDASLTATLFLPRSGRVSFAALGSDTDVEQFFRREFPDALPLMPDLTREFREHPQGHLGTIHTAPWHVDARALLLGDAAHGIVPFHGQGMNAAFEDCRFLDELLEQPGDWQTLFGRFETERREHAEAIAVMALENYAEMRERVLEERFLRQKSLALELERRFPERFIPRYSMVMFHPEIAYGEALRRGAIQQQILDELEAASSVTGTIDYGLAERLIVERLGLRADSPYDPG